MTFVRVRVVSYDRVAQRNYTVLVANAGLLTRYDANGIRVTDHDEVLRAVRDRFAGNVGRDEVIRLVRLYCFE